jgi:hypothetical protein
MVMGSPHLNQDDKNYSSRSFETINRELVSYEPDMIVVEYLPPDYPVGKGQDYRPEFNLSRYAEKWNTSIEKGRKLINDDKKGPRDCELGKAYFLVRDFPNAAYHWKQEDCKGIKGYKNIKQKLLDDLYNHEMSKIGFNVAKERNITEVESFDYRGEDVEWFIGNKAREYLSNFRLDALVEFWPVIPKFGTVQRQYQAHRSGETGNLIDYLDFVNSAKWIKLQYWAYEKKIRGIDINNVGEKQVENYRQRNRIMYANMKDEIEKENPERVLVIVGAGHKYFLDQLVYESKYDWKKPRIPDEAN